MNYTIKNELKDSKAEVLFIYGEKEMRCIKKSAKLLNNYLKKYQTYEAKGYNHGYLSIYLLDEWLKIATDVFDR